MLQLAHIIQQRIGALAAVIVFIVYSREVRARIFHEGESALRTMAEPEFRGNVPAALGARGLRRARADRAHRAHDQRVAHRFTNTQGLRSRKSTVARIPSRMLSFGCQPSARIRLQSRKINGLSPIQPRSPPVYSSAGATFIAAHI